MTHSCSDYPFFLGSGMLKGFDIILRLFPTAYCRQKANDWKTAYMIAHYSLLDMIACIA
jgi:hypothetical protein